MVNAPFLFHKIYILCYKVLSLIEHRSPAPENNEISTYQIALGLIGKSGDAIAHEPSINDNIASHIAVIYQLLEDGKLQPNEVNVVEKGGFEGVAEAVALQQKGQGGGKVVITLQEE